jgi:serine protease
MIKKIALAIILLLILGEAFAQKADFFKFPEGFSQNNYVAHSLIIKLKSFRAVNKNTAYITPDLNLSENSVRQLGIKNLQAAFPATHEIFKNKPNQKPVGNHTKKLSLIHTIEINPNIDLATAINLLRLDPAVEYAEPIYTNFTPMLVPNDPLAVANAQRYHLSRIKAYEAWDIETGNANVVIAILDSAFDLNNTDLSTQAIAPVGVNRDVADNDNIVSSTGFGAEHGMWVALCAAGRPNNNFGGAGTGFNSRFLPIKIAPNGNLLNITSPYIGLNGNGTSQNGGILTAARQSMVKIMNMSWGRKGLPSAAEIDILQTVVEDYDVVLIAAAGNENNEDFYYPASYDGLVMSVSSSNASDTRPNGATRATFNNAVDILAPGQDIIVVSNNTGASGAVNGTSFATPLVSGAAALVRNRYPGLKASQVIARLKTTADDIYSIADNANFRGKLGSGRLNMLRAVSDPLKAITLNSFSYSNQVNGSIFRGITTNLLCQFTNHLEATSNLNISLSTTSPFLNITDNQSVAGAINTNTIFGNNTDPFTIQVADNTPANTPALLRVTYQDEAYSYYEEFNILLNPGNSHINEAKFCVDDKGNLAVNDDNYFETSGMTAGGLKILREAGLMVALNPDTLSSTIRGNTVNVIDQDFITTMPLKPLDNTPTFYSTLAKFNDFGKNPQALNIEITQKTYAWNEAGLDRAVIVEYSFYNQNNYSINNIFAGIYANWNIFTGTRNRAAWDASNLLGYVSSIDVGLLGGIQLLTNQPDKTDPRQTFATHYAFDNAGTTSNDSIIRISDGFSKSEKYRVISGQVFRTNAGTATNGGDVSHAVSTRIENLHPGEMRTIAFAFIVGTSVNDLRSSASSVKARYQSLKTSPSPNLSDFSLCEGGSLVLLPGNGSNFNFYLSNPSIANTKPVYSGSSFSLTNVVNNQKVYITNIDSVFESSAKEVNVSVVNHETDFTLPEEQINLANPLNLSNASLGATQFNWAITRVINNQPNDFSFLENTNANSANPKIKFNRTGNYQIKLQTRTSENCIDSLIRQVAVFEDVTTGVSEFLQKNLQLFPNPSSGKVLMRINEFNEQVDLIITDGFGKEVHRQNWLWNPLESVNLDLNKLESGIYFCKIKIKNGYLVKKLIITN